jgi:putative acetyltransferase
MAVIIRDETISDVAAIRTVHRLAFAGEDEARLVDALRRSGDAVLSLVAERPDPIVGHVLLSRLEAPMRALALAPFGVLPDYQRRGIGSALIRAALERARSEGFDAVFVLGEPAYYRRFGFSVEDAQGYECVYAGAFFMIRVLAAGSVPTVGGIDYPAAFAGLA